MVAMELEENSQRGVREPWINVKIFYLLSSEQILDQNGGRL